MNEPLEERLIEPRSAVSWSIRDVTAFSLATRGISTEKKRLHGCSDHEVRRYAAQRVGLLTRACQASLGGHFERLCHAQDRVSNWLSRRRIVSNIQNEYRSPS